MKRCGSCTQFSSGILAKIVDCHFAKIDLCKAKWFAVGRRLCFVINRIDEYAHPLVTGAMRINGPAGLASGLNFNSVLTCFDLVIRILSLHYEIRMTVEIAIFNERSGVL